MSSYVITGASRGIGLELTKQLLALPSSQISTIIALSRSSPSDGLQTLLNTHTDRLHHVIAAVDDNASVQKAATDVEKILGNKGLDVLVNNAGIPSWTPDGIATMTDDGLMDVLNVNVAGVQRVTAAFIALLEKGKERKVINVSSTVGSITLAKYLAHLPTPAYKVSKAALHMLNMVWSLEYADKGFTFLCLSPGWLKTDLGGQGADLEVPVGVEAVVKIILESGPEQNGKLLNIHIPGMEESTGRYDGKEYPY